MSLRLDFCSYAAAKHAVMHWHYSKTMPVCKLVRIGVWEDERFIGAVIFGSGNASRIGSPFGLSNLEVCELVRVALDTHVTPTTRVVAIALKMLKRRCPGLKAVVSFADRNQGHEGVIYRAGNWEYLGQMPSREALMLNGKIVHNRSMSGQFGKPGNPIRKFLPKVRQLPKHKFVYWLDESARAKHRLRCDRTPAGEGVRHDPRAQIDT